MPASRFNSGPLDSLHYAVFFSVIAFAFIAALFGFAGICAGADGIATILFAVFLIDAYSDFSTLKPESARRCPSSRTGSDPLRR